MDPYLALQCSSASMSGGVGTASAFGPIFLKWGAPESVTAVGVTAGTLGNVMGSLIGGPVAAFLIHRHNLKSDPNDKPESAASGKVNELNNAHMVSMFGMVLLLCALGMPIYCILDNIPMIEMPKFIGCLFAGAIARNVMEAAHIKFYTPEVDAIEHMFLELYLALVLMTIDITALADVAGQMGVILLMQAVVMALFAIFVSYNMFGRDYGAAVMAAGNCGWGLRLRAQRRRQREGGHGPVRLAQRGLGALSLLRRHHRRHLQPHLPVSVRRPVQGLSGQPPFFWLPANAGAVFYGAGKDKISSVLFHSDML